MSKRTNPLDTNASGPADWSEANAAMAATAADVKRALADFSPKVERAIQAIENWSNVGNSLVALLDKIVPLVGALSTAEGVSTSSIGPMMTLLAELKEKASCLSGKCG
jgi:hypothetical protein